MKTVIRKIVLVLFILAIFAACNGLFYYPTSKDYKYRIRQKYEKHIISSKSGNKLEGWYFKSQTRKSKGLFVFFHGNARNISAHFKSFVWLTKHGYDYFLFDYSGYGNSEGRATYENIYKDGISALDYIIPKHAEKKNYKIIVGAMSLGGAIMIPSVANCSYKDRIDFLFVDCTFPSYKKVAKYHMSDKCIAFRPIPPFFISDKYAPEKYLNDIKDIPILVSHCREDEVVPYFLGEDLYRQLLNKKEFWSFSCGHTAGYWKIENQKRLADYFDKI